MAAGTRQDRGSRSGVLSVANAMARHSDVVLAGGVMMILAMMVLPLPPPLIDLMVATNIAVATSRMVVAMYTKEVLAFSVFPSLLLLVTLFRLAINVSSTRMILLQGDAGQIIASFGHFVVGGSVVVGIVVFLILLVIQFVVITNGAGRVAEVAARFTLDAMPGKQMSIDADLNAGIVTDVEARRRRREISDEADFYGAMDGASKFVKGDAIAALIIVAINLVGGIAIGVVQRGLSPGEAVSTYALLTVGDGLVSQIPALLISTATGLIVTRAASDGHLGADIGRQLLSSPRALFMVAAVLAGFGLVPGLPRFPFFVLAATIGGVGYLVREHLRVQTDQAAEAVEAEREEHDQSVDSVYSMLQVDPLEIEVGYGLIPLVDEDHGGSLLNRITIIRRQVAMDLGIVVPMIRIRDNLQLSASTYVVKLRGIEIGRGELMVNQFLAMNSGLATEEIEGVETTEPAFGLPARWVAAAQKQRAELLGYTVVDPPSVLTTHLSELIRRHAPELLSRQDTQTLLNTLKQEYPAVVEELVPGVLTVARCRACCRRCWPRASRSAIWSPSARRWPIAASRRRKWISWPRRRVPRWRDSSRCSIARRTGPFTPSRCTRAWSRRWRRRCRAWRPAPRSWSSRPCCNDCSPPSPRRSNGRRRRVSSRCCSPRRACDALCANCWSARCPRFRSSPTSRCRTKWTWKPWGMVEVEEHAAA